MVKPKIPFRIDKQRSCKCLFNRSTNTPYSRIDEIVPFFLVECSNSQHKPRYIEKRCNCFLVYLNSILDCKVIQRQWFYCHDIELICRNQPWLSCTRALNILIHQLLSSFPVREFIHKSINLDDYRRFPLAFHESFLSCRSLI